MTKLLFVCHGNICRSPMAESVMTYLVKKKGLSDIWADSAATSTEEIGNGVHPGTRRVLLEHGIPLVPHRARQITCRDVEAFDLIVGMDSANLRNLRRMVGESPKLHRLLDWSAVPREIADPWYTGDFRRTFSDVWEGCSSFLEVLAAGEWSKV